MEGLIEEGLEGEDCGEDELDGSGQAPLDEAGVYLDSLADDPLVTVVVSVCVEVDVLVYVITCD